MSDTIRWEQDADGVVVLTLDDPNQSANTMNDAYKASMPRPSSGSRPRRTPSPASSSPPPRRRSSPAATSTTCKKARREDAAEVAQMVRDIKADLRTLETLGKPVVAAINGAALGGGLEIASPPTTAWSSTTPRRCSGFPEVQLGLLPGRRRRGALRAHVRHRRRADEAAAAGPAPPPGRGAGDGPGRRGRRDPRRARPGRQGVDRGEPRGRPAVGRQGLQDPGRHAVDTRRSPRTCPRSRRTCASRSRARTTRRRTTSWPRRSRARRSTSTPRCEIEGRYFVDLVTGQVAKNMIQAFFFDLQAVQGARGRPEAPGADVGQEGRRARRRA